MQGHKGAAILSAALAVSATAQLASQDLPITKVALFSSGVGYFEHRGSLSGDATVGLTFTTAEVDDALKSLVVRDPGSGGAAGSPSVSYPSLETIDEALRGLRIDLSGSPTVASILGRLKGAELEVQAPETVSGRIVSVEKRPFGKEGIVRDTLVLLTSKGLRAFAIDDLASFRFTDPGIASDFERALALILGARDADRRRLDLRFPGTGSREVSFGYIVAAPVWKVSYRLDLSGDKPWIQGWAIVDNPSDQDWKDVSLTLVSGRPVSFIQNLYAPLRLSRPTLPLSIAGTATARVYDPGSGGDLFGLAAAEADVPMPAAAPAPSRAAGGGPLTKSAAAPAYEYAASATSLADSRMETTAARAAGDQFEFTVKRPVTLDRSRSAMLPLVSGTVTAEKLSIYTAGSGSKNPMLGLRLQNSLGMKLPAGPITIFDGGAYAGDALIEFLPEKDKRLVMYGQDLSVTCTEDQTNSRETIGVSVSKGVLTFSRRILWTHTYEFRNAASTPRKILVEHPIMGGADLVSPASYEEKTQGLYRFALSVPAGGSAKLEVKERTPADERVSITGLGSDSYLSYASSGELPGAIRDAFRRAAELRNKLEDARRSLTDLTSRKTELTNEQARIRQNLDAVGKESSQGQQYLKRLMDSEAALDALAAKIADARKAQQDAQSAFDSFVAGLDLKG